MDSDILLIKKADELTDDNQRKQNQLLIFKMDCLIKVSFTILYEQYDLLNCFDNKQSGSQLQISEIKQLKI